jgi:glutamate--cysteine ligase regulatory subunit
VEELKQHEQNGEVISGAKFTAIPSDEPSSCGGEEEGATKIVVKIFLNEFFEDTIEESLEHVLKLCDNNPPHIILAYAPTSKIQDGKFIWAEDGEKAKNNFKILWQKLREKRDAGQVTQLGISDMDLETIKDIFSDGIYDFTMLQININTCCLVPPELTDFTKEKNIQLLTHSDPQVLFPAKELTQIDMGAFKVKWIARFLETLVCRGILKKKKFIVNFRKIRG